MAQALTPPRSIPSDKFAGEAGFFGPYGGQHIPPSLAPVINAIAEAYDAAKKDPTFQGNVRIMV